MDRITYRNYVAAADRSVEHTQSYENACNEMLERLKSTGLNQKIQIQIPGDGMLYGEKREITDKPPQWWLVITDVEKSKK